MNETKKLLGLGYLDKAGIVYNKYELLGRTGYFEAPASKGRHLACRGGLFEHSINVTTWLLKLTETMDVEWQRPEAPYVVGMLHDLVKTECYRLACETVPGRIEQYEYVQPTWPGHGVASSLIAIHQLGLALNREETQAIIWHMGAFGLDKNGLREYDAALSLFPKQIIATHTADILAARVDEEYDNTKPDGSEERK